MPSMSYLERRGQLATYFDRTAVDAWSRLTSDAPVGRIRATVRAGRDEMRRTLLDWLPADLRGRRLLDAGCGTGALAVEAARRGARVVAIDLSPTLIGLARSRAPRELGAGSVEFLSGDMLDPALGRFDHVVAMDSLIHYRAGDVVSAIAGLAQRTQEHFAFHVRTANTGACRDAFDRALVPARSRAPAIEPMTEAAIWRRLVAEPRLGTWRAERTGRIASGFYVSQALELIAR